MAKCPSCQADISDDFGLITCKSCGAQVMIDFEGNVRNESASTDSAASEPLPEAAAPDAGAMLSLDAGPTPVGDGDADAPTVVAPTLATRSRAEFPNPAPPPPATSDMSDVAAFGNSPVSQAREGLLRFHILLAGIDTVDVRRSVREVLEDPRFLFNVDELLNRIKNGQMKISDVTAVKAAVLIQRLRPLPIEISWEQYAIHSS